MRRSRENDLLSEIKSAGSISIKKLSSKFNESEQSIRRSIRKLKKQNLIEHNYGIVSISPKSEFSYISDYSQDKILKTTTLELNTNTTAVLIATAMEVYKNQVVLLNDSPLSRLIIPYLADKSITVITNSLNIFDIARIYPNIRIILMGGVWDIQSSQFSGFFTDLILHNIRADLLLFEPSGIDLLNGLLVDDFGNINMISAMLKSVRTILLFSDDEKIFDKQVGTVVASTKTAHKVITPRKYSNEELIFFHENDIQIRNIFEPELQNNVNLK